MKVLFCSPYLSNDDVLKGGINTWGRYIISYYNNDFKGDLKIIPVSFDRTMNSRRSSKPINKIISGIHEYRKPIREAFSHINKDEIYVLHLCTSAGFGIFRDLLLITYAKIKGVKVVLHLHFGRIPELASLNNWEWKLILKTLKRVDVIVVMNRPTEATLKRVGFNNIVYLPNPISQSVLDKIEKLRDNVSRISRRILFAGHVIKTKGVYELVEACKMLDNIELRIVGRCSLEVRKDLEDIANCKDNSRWLHILGEQSQEDVIKEYLQADLFVFPSYTEGFPNVILEAMASGCTVISSNVGAIPEMLDIENSPCGICFTPRDKDEVYKSISLIIDDNEKKELLSQRARSRVKMMYSMPIVWNQIVKIWQ